MASRILPLLVAIVWGLGGVFAHLAERRPPGGPSPALLARGAARLVALRSGPMAFVVGEILEHGHSLAALVELHAADALSRARTRLAAPAHPLEAPPPL